MATMQEEIEKYKGQVKQYDAGRPNTSAPQPAPAFKGGEVVGSPESDAASRAVGAVGRGISKVGESTSGTSGGVAMRGPEIRGNMPNSAQLQDKPFSYQQQPGMGQIARGAIDAMAKTSGAISMPGAEQPYVNSMRRPIGDTVRTFDPSAVENRSSIPGMLEGLNTARINAQQERHALVGDIGRGMLNVGGNVVSAVGKFGEDMTEGRLLGSASSPVKEGGPVGEAQAATIPTTAAQLTTDQQQGADIRREIGARNYRMDVDGLKTAESGMNKPSPAQIKAMILEKNGLKNQVPVTARPGTVLSATPEEPRKTLPYSGVFKDGGPGASAQEALQRKQMDVMAAERADKSLLLAPGSRDYISPTLTEAQQRARQTEIYAQRKQDGEDVAAQQINTATTKALDDQAKGITSDRNVAMLPYEARRAIINNRNGLVSLNADMQQKRIDDAAKTADRTAGTDKAQMEDATKRTEIDARVGIEGQKLTSEERRAQMTDSTTRRGQDLEQDTNKTNAEIAAQSKALDREATIKAAQIRKPDTKDPVMLEKIKGYNAAIANLYALPGANVTAEMLEQMKTTFGLTGADTTQAGVNPAEDEDFLN